MFVLRTGAGAPPLVWVHGFACSHADWQAQLDHFAPRRTVLACDLRGHGKTAGAPADCSIETYGADLARLLEVENLSGAVLIGHSLGCRVVLQAALDAPDRVGGLVLIDGSCIGQGDPQAAERSTAAAIAAQGYASWAREFFAAMFVPSSDPKVKADTVARALELPEAIGSVLFPRMVAWDAGKMQAALAAVRVPLLVVQSTKLNLERVRVSLAPGDTSPWLEMVKRLVPRARIEIVAGVGHFPQIEAPREVNRLIGEFVGGWKS
jgi:pimeloyl-ACP methyl ester carboxylesterase